MRKQKEEQVINLHKLILLMIISTFLIAEEGFLIEKKEDIIIIKYLDKQVIIEDFPNSFDCQRYMKVSPSFYSLPTNIQNESIKVMEKFNSFEEESLKKKEVFLWDKNCLDMFYYKPWGERGIYKLSEEKTNKVLTKEVKISIGLKEKKIDSLDYLEFNLYEYADKLGKHYLLIEKYKLKNSISDVIKVYGFLNNKKSSILEWSFRDFSANGEPVYIHMDNNIQDIDNDNIIEPIFYYRVNNEVKVLIIYKGQKIVIRTQNLQNFLGSNNQMELGKILVGKLFYELPKTIQRNIFKILENMLLYDGGRFINIKEAMNNQTLRIVADEKLIEQER